MTATANATQTACEVAELFGQQKNAPVIGVANITGQYIFDRFVGDHDGDQTRMGIVRAMLACEVETVRKALKDAVDIAAKHGDAAKKTMQNHQTVMRLAYGACRFVPGFADANAKTGYQAMRVLARDALKQAGLKWNGEKAPTEADAEAAKFDKAQAALLADIRKDNPQRDGESIQQWEQRVRGLLASQMAEDEGKGIEAVMHKADVAALAEKVRKLCVTDDKLKDVLELLLADFDVAV